MLNVIKLGVIMLNVIMMGVIMLRVVAEIKHITGVINASVSSAICICLSFPSKSDTCEPGWYLGTLTEGKA